MKIEVGEYYKDPYHNDIVRITRIIGKTIYFEAIEDPHKFWERDQNPFYTIGPFKELYKHLKGYNTPLWKVLNS